MKRILIMGASSAIAQEVARAYAKRGCHLFLIGRNGKKIETSAQDLKVRGAAAVLFAEADANDLSKHAALVERAAREMGGIDVALVAHGSLPSQAECEASFDRALEAIQTNGLSAVSFASHLANYFETRRAGVIAVIGSVAGDRGRQSNYVYGASKAFVDVFLSGLRNRLFSSGVRVITIKPGFVDTPMTAAFKKGVLWAKPHAVARDIVGAVDSGKDILYTPGFWRLIMWVICLVPESLFKRLKL